MKETVSKIFQRFCNFQSIKKEEWVLLSRSVNVNKLLETLWNKMLRRRQQQHVCCVEYFFTTQIDVNFVTLDFLSQNLFPNDWWNDENSNQDSPVTPLNIFAKLRDVEFYSKWSRFVVYPPKKYLLLDLRLQQFDSYPK